jgi:hypothetical protein
VFVVTGGNAAPALESVERSLDDVAVTIEFGVEVRYAIWSLFSGMTTRIPLRRNALRIEGWE